MVPNVYGMSQYASINMMTRPYFSSSKYVLRMSNYKKDNNWDVILFAGNNMPPYENIDDTCIKVSRCQTTTGYLVNKHYIKVLVQNIKLGLTHLLNNPNEKHKFAIDMFWFVLQRSSNWYLITPPTVIQREDYSDIEKKLTNYKDMMLDLDKVALFKAIREKRTNSLLK